MNGRRLPLYGWLTAEAISLLGTRVSMIAIPWLVLITTGSATRTGLVSVAELTPLVLFKATGGPLVDRVGPRRLAISADLLSMASVGLIPILHGAGHLTFAGLLVLVAIGGGLRGPGDAAVGAMVPSLVASAEVPFERATGLGSAIERGATMLGAALAGGLVATIGAADAVAVDAASFGVCAVVLMATTRGLDRPSGQGAPGRQESGRAQEQAATSYGASMVSSFVAAAYGTRIRRADEPCTRHCWWSARATSPRPWRPPLSRPSARWTARSSRSRSRRDPVRVPRSAMHAT